MNYKILINMASRARPEKFHACMLNLRKCFTNYEVLLKIDRTDATVPKYLSKAYPEINLCLGYSNSKIDAINRDIHLNWDILVNTSDDILWKPGAGNEIIKNIEEDIFLHFPEPYAESQAAKNNRKSISVVSIMDKVYYQRFGYVYHPEYKSLYCDNEATEVARILGRYKFVNKVICEHIHPAAGKAIKDDQYRKNEAFGGVDKRTFLRRKENGFDLKIKKVS